MSKSTLRRMALRCADRLGVYHLLRRRRQGVMALGYHGVEERILDPRIQSLHLPLAIFEAHVDYLARHFEVLSLPELADRLAEGRGLDGRQVVITFDDGYRNNLHVAAPLLRSHGLPFAVFVCPERIATRRRFTTYLLRAAVYLTERTRVKLESLGLELELGSEALRFEAVAELSRRLKSAPCSLVESTEEELLALHSPARWSELDERFSSDALLSWEELDTLHEHGVTIGSHSHSHCILHDRQEGPRVHREVHASREALIERLGECEFFAYPNGRAEDIGARAVAEVDSAGYRLGFSLEFGEIHADAPRTLLPRVDADEDLDTLKFFLNTAYSPRSGESGVDRAVTG